MGVVQAVRDFFGGERGRTPKFGDLVSHEGAFGKQGDENGAYRVFDFAEKAAIVDGKPQLVAFCRFKNNRFTVTCLLDDLVWLEEDGAWMLPGRLLSREQKAKWMEQVGTKYPPQPEKHVVARAFLRHQGVI